MKKHVARTMTAGCVEGIGGFGGLFALDAAGMEEPVLVSGTDGVGTKLKIAMLLDKHDTIGIDCVAMCVNDVICCGAKPLFFLIISPAARMCRRKSRPSSRAWRKAACRRNQRSSAAKRRSIPA